MARPDAPTGNPVDCAKCGRPRARDTGKPTCAGHNRAGEPCKNGPLPGQRVCRMHGGRSPQAKAAGERRVQEQAAAAAVATLGIPVDVSPTDALLEEVRWTAGHVQWLRRRVQELHEEPTHQAFTLDGRPVGTANPSGRDALVWGTTKVVDKGSGEHPGTDTTQEARPSIWYDLYERERKHLVAVCQAAIKAGVEERRVRLAEQQGELVGNVIKAILADLGLTPEQQAQVSKVVPRHLRLFAGGAA